MWLFTKNNEKEIIASLEKVGKQIRDSAAEETLELRECKKCFSIVPTHRMYKFIPEGSFWQYTIGSICQRCANLVAEIAAKEAMKKENDKFSPKVNKVTISDLTKGKTTTR